MLDEDEEGGLRAFGEVLLGYGERQFDGNQPTSRKGVWASVLLMSGQFERVGRVLNESLLKTNRCVPGCGCVVGQSRY